MAQLVTYAEYKELERAYKDTCKAIADVNKRIEYAKASGEPTTALEAELAELTADRKADYDAWKAAIVAE